MMRRNLVFANNEVYHVLNRAIAEEEILLKPRGLKRMLDILNFYKFPHKISYSHYKKMSLQNRREYDSLYKKKNPIIKIFAFALMPTHYHLVVKQLVERGIPGYISKIQNSYAKYYNILNKRDGGVFKRPFRAKRIEDDNQLVHVVRYIHLNPVTSYLIEFDLLESYRWNSYTHYVENSKNTLLSTDFVLKLLGSEKKLIKFTENQVDYQRKLKNIKNITLE